MVRRGHSLEVAQGRMQVHRARNARSTLVTDATVRHTGDKPERHGGSITSDHSTYHGAGGGWQGETEG